MKANLQSNIYYRLPGIIALLFFTLIFSTSCRSKKIQSSVCLPDNGGVNKESKNEVFKTIEKNRFEFEYFSASANGDFSDGANEYGLNASLRMQRNEKIWISVSFLFIEAARILIDKDSVYILNYLEKSATVRSLGYVSNYLGTQLSIGQIQDALVGNSVLQHDVNSSLDNSNGQLKIITRIKQFLFDEILNPENFRPLKVNTTETGGKNKLDLEYSDYTQVNCRLLPQKVQLLAVTNTSTITASLNYSDISTEPITSWPFNIPAKYERK